MSPTVARQEKIDSKRIIRIRSLRYGLQDHCGLLTQNSQELVHSQKRETLCMPELEVFEWTNWSIRYMGGLVWTLAWCCSSSAFQDHLLLLVTRSIGYVILRFVFHLRVSGSHGRPCWIRQNNKMVVVKSECASLHKATFSRPSFGQEMNEVIHAGSMWTLITARLRGKRPGWTRNDSFVIFTADST